MNRADIHPTLTAHPELRELREQSTTWQDILGRDTLPPELGPDQYLVRSDTVGDQDDLYLDALARGSQPSSSDPLARRLFEELPIHLRAAVRHELRGTPPEGTPTMTTEATTDLDKLTTRLRKVTIDGTEYFVAEGDLLLTPDELVDYAGNLNAPAAPPPDVSPDAPSELLVVSANGKPVRWAPGVVLSYYIKKETFTAAQYAEVRSNTVDATEAWMAICGVEFRHLVQLDTDLAQRTAAAAVFTVQFINAGGRFIAAAFFPNDPPPRRRVLIDPSYFAMDLVFDKVGVLRHELGHTLGFRHEHIRSGAPAVCPDESLTDVIELTDYDPLSVMHYFCGQVGSKTLDITTKDRDGARTLYGSPLSQFSLTRP